MCFGWSYYWFVETGVEGGRMGFPHDDGPSGVDGGHSAPRHTRGRLLPHDSQGDCDGAFRARLQPRRSACSVARCLGGLDAVEGDGGARLLSPRRLRRVSFRGVRSGCLRGFSVLCRRRALRFEAVRGFREVGSAPNLCLRGVGSSALAYFCSLGGWQSLDGVGFSGA